MSRNKEKANSTLNRYQAQISREAGVLDSDPNLRPKYVQSVESIPQAERWRTTIVTEISVKLTKINDPTIPEFEVRELNDSLNKLHREKRAWEHHIKQLGGNDYINFGGKTQRISVKGTRYFGRARELAEVKQMLKGTAKPEVTKKDEAKEPGLEYYGVFDGGEWNEPIRTDLQSIFSEINAALGEHLLDAPVSTGGEKETGNEREKDTKKLPTSEDVERWIVERKKRELMAQLGL